jgi:hypothetical protein
MYTVITTVVQIFKSAHVQGVSETLSLNLQHVARYFIRVAGGHRVACLAPDSISFDPNADTSRQE